MLFERGTIVDVPARRYRCTRCRAIVVSCPSVVRRRHLYSASTIALALALWSTGTSASAVRAAVSPFRRVGPTAAVGGWASLRRWAGRCRELWRSIRAWPGTWTPRQIAERAAASVAAYAPEATGSIVRDAEAGAVHAP